MHEEKKKKYIHDRLDYVLVGPVLPSASIMFKKINKIICDTLS